MMEWRAHGTYASTSIFRSLSGYNEMAATVGRKRAKLEDHDIGTARRQNGNRREDA